MIKLLNRRALAPRNQRDARSTAIVHRAAALCLAYPGEGYRARLAVVRAALAELPAVFEDPVAALSGFCEYAAAADPYDLAGHYVETFDQRNRHALHLSWWTDGDTRNRGASLVRFKQLYRAHGLDYSGEDLPDHLTVVLEFASEQDPDAQAAGIALLAEHAAVLGRLHAALVRCKTPYAPVIAAVIATLPEPNPAAERPETGGRR